MRIISGEFKGRRFTPPADKWPTRPTTDFAKEGLYNVLANRLDWEEVTMLDLFGGTGSHSYESISRGCRQVVYVDKHRPAFQFVQATAKALEIEDFISIINSDVFQYINTCSRKFDYIFAGPPYGLESLDAIPDKIFEHELLEETGLFVLEHNPNHNFENHPRFESSRNYGTTIFSFFS
jgi:16S rRNA (guanine966-N2)-methyltransferase